MTNPPRICKPAVFRTDAFPSWPVALGRKGPSWFMVYTQPRGMGLKREHLPINTLPPSDPFPQTSPDIRPRFAYMCPLDSSALTSLLAARVSAPPEDNQEAPAPTPTAPFDDLAVTGSADSDAERPIAKLTGRRFATDGDQAVEVEVLLDDAELLHACTHCEKWEMAGWPTFERCAGCTVRNYCSAECQRSDLVLHTETCALLKDGRFSEAEGFEQKHREGTDWQLRYATIAHEYPAELIDGPDHYLPGYSYGVHIPWRGKSGDTDPQLRADLGYSEDDYIAGLDEYSCSSDSD